MKTKNTKKMEAKLNAVEKRTKTLECMLGGCGVVMVVNAVANVINTKKTKQNTADIQVLSSMMNDSCDEDFCECD